MKAASVILILLLFAGGKCLAQDTTTNNNWVGRWERAIWKKHASLEITAIETDSLIFVLTADSAGVAKGLKGKAFISNDIAVYNSVVGNDSCLFEFRLSGDSLITINAEMNGGLIKGIDYKGRYVNSAYSHENDDEPHNFFELGILTQQQDSTLQLITGDSYLAFFNATHLTTAGIDIDDLHAKVFMSVIEGLSTYMENIIMVDDNNNMWAAVIDTGIVRYFTNDKTYTGKLPKTIERWRKNFKNLEVIYESKK